ncbi:tRNA (adenosine(37)-N6)-threonylcarbamoyltransferase complex dimerization subunit type 1 TsaB [Gulosibacter molinativorax]|uniref:tRNA (Adenosine(37)-N6)-threonylcarbamoyltransferase complex dimerization subunit type 1 TsaB n=1 Tax=Gulosibacter molinativorax TaxID=256821 RepID=A0ABT7C490_9MICO|nr:tRNA (adenosine(37)-N6)-threonylcarbamoyltransferase complex dimerization subunit type 1 TsaB [Gulosibacter molinativorax]MDJ1370025.1 tRNA (adenosine(37)-N6)-threonylcarbamoyltransferase complex dimerization subunit type 1 TsaB [Gulosibacter molinativorax]
MLLAIDTSAGTDVAVVSEGGRVLAQSRTVDTRRHAEIIGPSISFVLREAGIGPQHVTQVVSGMGPGSFTGLRVGIAAARTFAFARNLPLIPMPSHEAIAHEWRAAHPEHDGALNVTTDAKRRELALTHFAAGETVAGDFVLVQPDAPELSSGDATHVPATQVSAAHLALAWLDREAAGVEAAADEVLYLRAPDAKPGAVPKRVTG